MNLPTSISLHPQGGLVAHYPDRALPFSQLLADERAVVMAALVERYNGYEALADIVAEMEYRRLHASTSDNP